MKLLLCLPSQRVSHKGVIARPHVNIPLGVLSMAAYLRQQDWPGMIEIYDARISAKFWTDHSGEKIFGDTDDEVFHKISREAPDVIGISNMFSSQISRAYQMAIIAKEAAANAVVVLGGPHASSFPDEVLNHPAVDYVVMGEGEERLAKILQCLENGEDICFEGVLGKPEDKKFLKPHKTVKVNFIDNVDDLPLPAYDLINMERYFTLQRKGYSPRSREWGKRAVTVLTSRGCPQRCVFCSIHGTAGYKWRSNSPEYIERHLQHLLDTYEIDFIHFEDDNLTHDPSRFDVILDILLSLPKRISWDTPNGIRADTWTLERVRRSKEAGCQALTAAIESANQDVLNGIVKKRLDLAKVNDLMAYCNEVGLRLNAFYIIGFPGETEENMRTTVEFALNKFSCYGVYPMLQPLIPLPGTPVHDEIITKGLHIGPLNYRYNEIHTPEFTPETVDRLYREFLRRKIIIFFGRMFISTTDFWYNLKLLGKYPEIVRRTIVQAVFGTSSGGSSSPKNK